MTAPTATVDLRPRFGPIRDQGARPTCLAFAASDLHAALRGPWSALSCEFAFYHAQRRASRPPTRGALLGAMLDALREDGQPVESDWQYLQKLPKDRASWRPPPDIDVVHRRDGDRQPVAMAEIHRRLDDQQPSLLLMTLSRSFFELGSDGVVLARPEEPPDSSRRHAVVAVGRGTLATKRFILIRNSWGADWGDQGYGWLDEDYLAPRLTRIATLKDGL